MLCPQCQTELPDAVGAAATSTRCPQCGYIIVPATPVVYIPAAPVAPVYQPQPATFSYLPAGTPQWPTSIPSPDMFVSHGLSGWEPAQADSRLGNELAGDVGEKVIPGKRALSIPTLITLFIVTIIVGGGLTYGLLALGHGNDQAQAAVTLHLSSPTPNATTPAQASPSATTQTSQLPTPTSFLTINNTQVGLSINYPSDWVLDPIQTSTQGAFLSMHPSQQNGVFIALQRYSASTSTQFKTTADVNSNNLAQFQGVQGVASIQEIQPTTAQQTIGGVAWDEKDATFITTSGVSFHLISVAVQYKKLYYTIVYYAPNTVFTEAVQKYFQPMLTSIKFLT